MKVIKYLIFIAVVVAILIVGISLLLPKSSYVERSIVIKAPKSLLFDLVSDLHNFQKWSPWSRRDPNMQTMFEGPSSGVGTKMVWKSEELGNGSMEITEYDPYDHAAAYLDFGDMGDATTNYTISSDPTGSKIVWSFRTDHPGIVGRYMGLMMDKWVGKDYEEGLANLKEMAESMPAISKKEVSYSSADTTLKGYLAMPMGDESRPGVIVVHEWWGHNEYARKRADMLAELGYNALALDMFGEGKTADHPQQAMEFVTELMGAGDEAKARFDAAVELLTAQSTTNKDKLAAIGYCFGGSVVLSMARSGDEPLKGVVSFHGGLQGLSAIENARIESKILVLNGQDDPFVTTEQKEKFKAEMDVINADYEFIEYPGVVHAFTNPDATKLGEKFDLPLKYNEQADVDSWKRMEKFLSQVFK